MHTPTHFRALLAQETAHLARVDQRQVNDMIAIALALVDRHPQAPAEPIADKLLTLFPGSERWVRVLVAKAAIEAAGGGHRIAA